MLFFCLIRSIYKTSDNKQHPALWENIITSFLRYCSHKKYRGGFWVFKQFAREFQGERRHRVFGPAQVLERVAEVVVGLGEAGTEGDRLTDEFDRGSRVTLLKPGHTQ